MSKLTNKLKKLGYKIITKKVKIDWSEFNDFINKVNEFEKISSKINFTVRG